MMVWSKSCGETTSPELHWSLAANKCQTFEKEEYSGPDAVQGVVLWCPGEHPDAPGCTRGERGGRNTQGRVSFITITQENVSFIIITQEKLENIHILLTIVWICFQFFFFSKLAAAKTFAGCYFAYWGTALSDYLSQPTTASRIFQHDLDGQIFG